MFNCKHTHQDCKLATQQLRAQRLLVRVDINDALFDSCVLIKKGQKKIQRNQVL